MLFAPKIRKDILEVLDAVILPALQNQQITQILAEPPFDFSMTRHQVLQKKWLEHKEFQPLQTVRRWEREFVVAYNAPIIMFAYSGICYERIGITSRQASAVDPSARKSLGGINLLELSAPALLCHPAFTLRSLGKPRPESSKHAGRSLLYQITKTGFYVSLNIRGPEEESVTHSLEITDPLLAQMGQMYIEELRTKGAYQGAQAQQLALMHRLKRYLQQQQPVISNSCWIVPPNNQPPIPPHLTPKNIALCQELTEYIITHLHTPLTLKKLATHFNISTVHLNGIFKQMQGTTVMHFVTRLRIEAAKNIIKENPERINDIARLVGFSSSASFCNVFRKHTGYSPNKFRQINSQKQ